MNYQTPFAVLLAASLALATPAFAETAPPAPGHKAVTPKPRSINPTAKDTTTRAATGPTPTPDSPIGDKSTPSPPTLPGFTAYVLMDAASGAVLAEAAPNLQVPPASLAKLMTAHLTYQALHHGALKMDQTIPVSPDAWHAGGSRMFIDPTSVVTVNDLLHGLIIDSGNDAAVALAEQIAGAPDAFTQMMNDQASKIGITNTTYTNPTGLPDPNMHTTAMDVAKLTRVILREEPEITEISKLQSYTFDNITQASWNPVLQHDPTVDGLKTGLTNESGHCIDATATRSGKRLIAVVMGGPSWHAATAAIGSLLNFGDTFFADVTIATIGQPIDTLQSPLLQSGSVPVGPAQSMTLTLPSDEAGGLTHVIAYTADLSTGVTKGQTLGAITYLLNGNTVMTIPAVALADSPEAGLFTKIQRDIQRML